jgi:hypothetical protein
MTEVASTSKEWRVRLDLQLDEEQHDRVTRAIQAAVLAAVAEFDLASEYSVRLVGPASRARLFRDPEEDPFGPLDPGRVLPDGAVMKIPDEIPL